MTHRNTIMGPCKYS